MCIGRLHVTEHYWGKGGNTVYAKSYVQYKHVQMYMYSTPTDTNNWFDMLAFTQKITEHFQIASCLVNSGIIW